MPLICAATLSRLAGRMFILTLVLFLLARFSSPALAGWLTFAAIVPGLLVSPVAGVQLDRLGPTIAVRIDMIASATFIGAISIVGWLDWATPPVLLFLVILFSLAGPLGAAGTRTLLPRLVPSHALDRANALDTAIYAVVDVVGPAMAGIIVAWLGPESAMSMISFSYAAAAICLSFVPLLPGLASRQISFMQQWKAFRSSPDNRRCAASPSPIRCTRSPGACSMLWSQFSSVAIMTPRLVAR